MSNGKDTQHWNVLKGQGGVVNCCICKKKLHSDRKWIGNHPDTGEELWRHSSCGCGSNNWKKLFNGFVDKDINKILKGESYGWKS